MAFRDFTFPQVQQQLGVRVEDVDLFSETPPFAVRPAFAAFLRDGTALALANSTEKAKSEFIISWKQISSEVMGMSAITEIDPGRRLSHEKR